MKKLVSIVLPVYNGEKYLSQSIDSVLNQTYDHFELIIVNDCSTDKTEEIVQGYLEKDSRIVYIKNEVNSKLPTTLNDGFAKAQGEYYTWTSDDNMYHRDAIEKMVKYLEEHPDIGLVCCDYNMVDEIGTYCGSIKVGEFEQLIFKNNIGACFLYRADVARDIGEYRTDLYLVEDYEYWLRISYKYPIAYYHEVLYEYRHHKSSLTSTKAEQVKQVLRDFQWENFSYFESSHFPEQRLFDYYEYIVNLKQGRFRRRLLLLRFTLKHPRYFKRIFARVRNRAVRLFKSK